MIAAVIIDATTGEYVDARESINRRMAQNWAIEKIAQGARPGIRGGRVAVVAGVTAEVWVRGLLVEVMP